MNDVAPSNDVGRAGGETRASRREENPQDPVEAELIPEEVQDAIERVRRGKSLSLRNHGRALGSKVASQMRDAVAAWVRPMLTADFTISAQNQSVAQLYIAQFPELQVIGRDWMGHPQLSSEEARQPVGRGRQ